MDFFNSLSVDIKVLVVCAIGAALLAVFTGNKKREKQYILVLALLAMVAIFRFNQAQQTAEEKPPKLSSAATGKNL
jgi:hypothetical protein